MRLDLFLSQNGFAASRQKAQTMIDDGLVFVDGVCKKKASAEVPEGAQIEIRGEVCPYVGRGGYKLAGALDCFGLDVRGFTCVDIGSSTGGFTDCLLQRGAASVCAIDSGSGQLAEKLRCDARVSVHENYNARNLDTDTTGGFLMLAVCDVSFISVTYMFDPVLRVLCPYDKATGAGSFVALIKPQFEAGRANIGKNGIVRDEKVHLQVLSEVIGLSESMGLACLDLVPSPITGGDGNREFLAHFVKDVSLCQKEKWSDSGFLLKKIRR